jgi:ribosome maturation factor RimP
MRGIRTVGKRDAIGGVKKSTSPPQRLTPVAEERIRAQVWPMAESLCDAEGLELVQVEYRRERGGRIMRLFIDKPGGVTLEDCAAISRELGDLLDVHLPDLGPYHLEVSSPGPRRPLAREADFERFRGQRAGIRTLSPIDGQKNFSGVLEGVAEGRVRITIGPRTAAIPLEAISKAFLMES